MRTLLGNGHTSMAWDRIDAAIVQTAWHFDMQPFQALPTVSYAAHQPPRRLAVTALECQHAILLLGVLWSGK